LLSKLWGEAQATIITLWSLALEIVKVAALWISLHGFGRLMHAYPVEGFASTAIHEIHQWSVVATYFLYAVASLAAVVRSLAYWKRRKR
jgi:hypothetical protein